MPEIEHRILIRKDRDDIFRILTTGEGWNSWFTDGTILNLKSDGTGDIRLKWNSYGPDKLVLEDGGKILHAEQGRRFTFQWTPGESTTTVAFTLEPADKGTLVSVRETGYSSSRKDLDACVKCAAGWGEALVLLKFYAEHGQVCKQDLG
ncbi:SRPBCC domain-containing protein [Bacillus infantis]|uniref:SRPBCC family protein n=1 Tax=Bacillus infantis TaxID=324767 RepID=UPI001CD60D96|nr:SRPBCC domain-containing protein [Bacillus infantis]MCA1035175.1 SRPBCC domain-containing protein [Bacillus infantis]